MWLCSKGIPNKLPRSYMPLDITQYTLGCLCVHRILEGSSGYLVSRFCDDTGIQLPRGINSSIHELQTRGYELVSYHGIRVPRSNLLCCPLLCSILHPYQELEIILNPVNVIEYPVLELKKREGKRRILAFGPNL